MVWLFLRSKLIKASIKIQNVIMSNTLSSDFIRHTFTCLGKQSSGKQSIWVNLVCVQLLTVFHLLTAQYISLHQ